jgi:hypothetical protein
MQTKTKTNKNRTATKAVTTNTQTTKTKTQTTTPCSSWLKQNTNRPKTVIVELQRNANGYSIKDAVVLSPVNQHASRRVPVNARALTEDINRRGIIV